MELETSRPLTANSREERIRAQMTATQVSESEECISNIVKDCARNPSWLTQRLGTIRAVQTISAIVSESTDKVVVLIWLTIIASDVI